MTRLITWLRRWWPGVALAALAGLLGMGLWFSVAFAGRAGSTSFRLVLWREAARTFAEHPLVGVGPANFGRALLRRNDPALPRVQNTTAHNVYLNLAAEQGAVGLAAGAYLLSTAGIAWWRQWRLAAARRERIWLVSAGVALVGFAVQSGVDTYTALPNLLPVVALAAYALSGQADERPLPGVRHTALRQWMRLAPLAALLAACVGQSWIAWGDARFETSVWLASQGQTEAARDRARMAYEIDPDWPLYAFQLAHLEAQGPPQAWPAAIAHYQAALALEPVHGRHTANLAGVLWRAGDQAAALEMLQLAAASEPDPLYDLNRGLMLEMTGDWPGAIEAYALALARDPSLAESDFWRADAARNEHWPTITNTAANILGGWHDTDLPRWRLRLAQAASAAGIEAEARAVLGFAPADCEALTALAQLALARGQPTEALRQATQAVEANGRCGAAFQVRGAAWAAASEPGLAEAEWRKALFAGYLLAGFDLGRIAEAQGDLTAAEAHYRNALLPHAVREDIEVTLFGRQAAFDLLPPLIRIGISQHEAAPWLALASLLERQNRTAEAKEVYAALAAEDPFVLAVHVDE
jgi:tetratricopeptide (TPR) repeat protein